MLKLSGLLRSRALALLVLLAGSGALFASSLAEHRQMQPVLTECRKQTQQQKWQKEQQRAEQRRQKHCAKLQARLDRINLKLDAGYREPKGNELRRQRRELQSQIFRDCR